MSQSVFIGTIEKFPLHALSCLMRGEFGTGSDSTRRDVETVRATFEGSHYGLRFEQRADLIAHSEKPLFGEPGQTIPVEVWGVPRDAIS